MKVSLAEHAGACYGVKRALDIAEDAAHTYSSVQTLGPLIHNPLVVKDLQEKGVGVAEDLESVTASTIIIRSHGVTPETMDALSNAHIEIIDATCPHVLRAQKAAFELSSAGAQVLVVGEKNHPEVEGLYAWGMRGGGKVYVVSSARDIPENLREPIGVVVQTTQSRALLNEILTELESRGLAYDLRDTICSATGERQNAVQELALRVDAMVVIGGKNSSNTTRLAEICRQYTSRVFHIESVSELQKQDFEAFEHVGVCAGASTPDSQISAVVDCLSSW